METVSKLRFWCYKILPLVYDDSLSYYEAICKATQKLNEVIGNVNELPDYINKEIAEQIGNNGDLFERLFGKILKAIAVEIDDNEYTENEKFGGEIFWHNGELVECISHMDIGTRYVDGTNISGVDIASLMNDIREFICGKTQKYNKRADKKIVAGEYLFWKDEFVKAKQDVETDTLLTDEMFEVVTIGDELKKETDSRVAEVSRLDKKIDDNVENLQTQITSNDGDIEALQKNDVELKQNIDTNDTNVNNRISNIVAQSGNDNTEIVDGRKWSNITVEKTSATIGDAIRGQIEYINENLGEYTDNLLDIILLPILNNNGVTSKIVGDNYILYGRSTTGTSFSKSSEALPVNAGETYTFYCEGPKVINAYVRCVNSSDEQILFVRTNINQYTEITIPTNATATKWFVGAYESTDYGDGTTVHFQITKGTEVAEYMPHLTGKDNIARNIGDNNTSSIKTISASTEQNTKSISEIISSLNNGAQFYERDLSYKSGYVHEQDYNKPGNDPKTIYSNYYDTTGTVKLTVNSGLKALVCNIGEDNICAPWSAWHDSTFTYTPTGNKWLVEVRKTNNEDITPEDGNGVKAFIELGTSFTNPIAYVATDGNDDNYGTLSSPFKTIQKAIDANYKTIFVKEGTYNEKIEIINKNNVTIALNRQFDYFQFVTNEISPKIVLNVDGIDRGIYISNSVNINISDFEIKNATVNGVRLNESQNVSFVDCIAHDIGVSAPSGSVGGYVITKANADFNNCIAYNIGTDKVGEEKFHCDGFNIHGTGSTNFINCKAWNCEDDGISHHDACEGLIDGGEWYNCGKAGIASPTHGARVNISNAYCHDNNIGIYAGNDSAVTDRGNIIISSCVCKNNKNKDVVISNYYKVIGINFIYDTITGENNITNFR